MCPVSRQSRACHVMNQNVRMCIIRLLFYFSCGLTISSTTPAEAQTSGLFRVAGPVEGGGYCLPAMSLALLLIYWTPQMVTFVASSSRHRKATAIANSVPRSLHQNVVARSQQVVPGIL